MKMGQMIIMLFICYSFAVGGLGTSASATPIWGPKAARRRDPRARAWAKEPRPRDMVQAETGENALCFAFFFLEAIVASTLGGPWAWVPSPPKCECYEAQGLARGPRPRARTQGQTGENTQCFAIFWREKHSW